MAATVETRVYTGASPGSGATATEIRFKNNDDNNIDLLYPLIKPPSGTNYSFWKTIALHATGAPDTAIHNVRIFPSITNLLLVNSHVNVEFAAINVIRDSAFSVYDSVANPSAAVASDTFGDYSYVIGNYAYNAVDERDEYDIYFYDTSNIDAFSFVNSVTFFRDPPVGQTSTITPYIMVAFSNSYIIAVGTAVYGGGPASPDIIAWAYDVTNKMSPSLTMSSMAYNGYNYHLRGALKGNYLYMSRAANTASGNDYFSVLDLSSLPTVSSAFNQALSTSESLTGDATVMEFADYAVISLTDSGIVKIIDVSDLGAAYNEAAEISGLTDPRAIAIQNDKYLYISERAANRIAVYDITDPTSPSFHTSITDATNLTNIFDMRIDDQRGRLYCSRSDGFTVLNIEGIETPSISVIASYDGTDHDAFDGSTEEVDMIVGDQFRFDGITFQIGDQQTDTYDQATGSEDNGDEMTANHSQISSKTDFNTYSESSPLPVGLSVSWADTTGRITKYLVFQADIDNTVIAGLKDMMLEWQYDEN